MTEPNNCTSCRDCRDCVDCDGCAGVIGAVGCVGGAPGHAVRRRAAGHLPPLRGQPRAHQLAPARGPWPQAGVGLGRVVNRNERDRP